MSALKVVPENESLLIVATGKYIGEGFDAPRLDALFLAMPFSWKGTLAQYVGRLHRNYERKRDVRVYDYVDIHVPMLERMYQKRLRGYAELGYQTMSDDSNAVPGMIYTVQTYPDAFTRDLRSASREVVISAPNLSRSHIRTVTGSIPSGMKLRVIVRSPEEYPLKQQHRILAAIKTLEDLGAMVITRSNVIQYYATFDASTVWYGGISFLSSPKPDDTAIRFESPDLAGELLDLEAE